MYIDVGTVTPVRRRRLSLVHDMQPAIYPSPGCSQGVPIQVCNRWRCEQWIFQGKSSSTYKRDLNYLIDASSRARDLEETRSH